jgi:hypothetical protein
VSLAADAEVPMESGARHPPKPRRSALASGLASCLTVFDLSDVCYIEGAPMEWRRWLTPGTPVVLRFEATGLTIYAHDGQSHCDWQRVAAIDVRGPDEPERRYMDSPMPMVRPLPLLAAIAVAAAIHSRPKESYCWLAVKLEKGGEMIFEVENILRPALQEFLDLHSG